MLKINYMTEAKGVIDELNCHLGKAAAMAKIDLPEVVEEVIEKKFDKIKIKLYSDCNKI